MNRQQQSEWVSRQPYGFWPELRKLAVDLPGADAPTRDDTSAIPINRRSAMGILAASAALAGLPGCRRPDIELRPYTKMPEFVVPGMSLFYATTLTCGGGALPVLVETHEGRPTKVEGHPQYSPTQGASDAIAQATILQLYDPDRLRQVRRGGITSSWNEFDTFVETHFAELLQKGGQGLRILSDATASPALKHLRRHMRQSAPEAQWHVYEPLRYGYAEQAARRLFGKTLRARSDFGKPDVIVSLDADFLGRADQDAIANSRAFASRRTPAATNGPEMNRLYVVEPAPTLSGGMADHRLRLAAHAIPGFALALAAELRLFGPDWGWDADAVRGFDRLVRDKASSDTTGPAWAREIAADLLSHRGRSLVVAGPRQPPLVHALVQLMNVALGNVSHGVRYVEVPDEDTGSIEELAEDAAADRVNTLIIVGGNPAYDAPADLTFAARLAKIPNTIRLGLYEDETAQLCQWRLPAAHTFESWGDAETDDGYYLPVQPMIAPLYNGRSTLTVLAQLLSYETNGEYDIVRRAFEEQSPSLQNAGTFDRWLHDGLARREPLWFVPQLSGQAASGLRDLLQAYEPVTPAAAGREICFQADSSVFDGRFANLGWLQEMPDPITKLTWDNAALISADTASALKLATGDVVRLSLGERSVEAPVLIQPGHADHSITLPLGYGRSVAGRVGKSVGFNAYVLRTSRHLAFAAGVLVEPLGSRHQFAFTQQHDRLEHRDLAREQTIAQFVQRAAQAEDATRHDTHSEESRLIDPPRLDGRHQWGMVIDLSRCVGCSACVVACQSENNIPVVGKNEVARGRAMHWIRVDRYYRGPESDPEIIHEPLACVHCENAPCETVCPVNAAVHSPEGLNLQVYNRCVGTRYCSNNCPYKVRRFNWFDYNQRPLDQLWLGPLANFGMAETLKMQKNPDVTVRMRGVMEKCTYCVQRIERGKAGAKLASPSSSDYTLHDGQVVPACAQACPAQAIVFGDLSDVTSRVSQQKRDARRFDLLAELGTKPRTSYLTRIRNPNPRLAAALRPFTKDDGHE